MNDRDPAHEKAIELWNLSIETGKLLVTSNFVIGETYTWMRRRSNLYF
jgi:predicted nucleic acid-binding protein